MPQIWLHDVSISLGGPLLLQRATLAVETGERIGLLGRNGAGKSTLLKLLHGDIPPDSGEIIRSPGSRVGLLPQEVPDALPGTVFDIVAAGGERNLEMLRHYHALALQLSQETNAPHTRPAHEGGREHGDPGGTCGRDLLKELERVQHRLEAVGAWDFHQRVETVIGWMNIDQDAEFSALSAGTKRRVFLAKALVDEPDVLLLDEPTNHLDIDSIRWLEEFLLRFTKTLVFVTHDRAFLQRMASRILEIDRGHLLSFACGYDVYLERRQAMWDTEEREWQEFDKRLAKEEVWIRQGIRARRTRNEGRVRALEQLRLEREQRQERIGNPQIAIQEATRSGRLVIEAKKITFAYPSGIGPAHDRPSAARPDDEPEGQPIVRGFSTTIIRGDRVGIFGPNGAGKTTLLRLLLGDLQPQKGRVRLGVNLKIAYFDQLRATLDDRRTLRDSIADGGDTILFANSRRHVVGYLQDFLFSPDQINAPVGLLSGGERNRLLLAKLFAAPSNVLVLDEPTNDLDMETLALLEEQLLSYTGTILLVSHDRAFLNNVVTSTLVFDEDGALREYAGGYDDWMRQRQEMVRRVEPRTDTAQNKVLENKPNRAGGQGGRNSGAGRQAAKRRLSYKETKELQALPERIEALEAERGEIATAISSPDFYEDRDTRRILEAHSRLDSLQHELDVAYLRWEELEEAKD